MKNDFTIELRKQGGLLSHLAEKHDISYSMLHKVISGERKSPKIVQILKEEDLFQYLPEDVQRYHE